MYFFKWRETKKPWYSEEPGIILHGKWREENLEGLSWAEVGVGLAAHWKVGTQGMVWAGANSNHVPRWRLGVMGERSVWSVRMGRRPKHEAGMLLILQGAQAWTSFTATLSQACPPTPRITRLKLLPVIHMETSNNYNKSNFPSDDDNYCYCASFHANVIWHNTEQK